MTENKNAIIIKMPTAKNDDKADRKKKPCEIYFSREEMNINDLDEFYSFKPIKSENALYDTKNYLLKYYKPSGSCMGHFLLDRFPFFKWIVTYDYQNDLLKDFIAGITIGVVQIPQGLAYSMMAGLPPVLGLYVSFFTVLVYILLGTSRHLSLGVYAIISLMVKAFIDSSEGKLFPTKSEVLNNLNFSYSANSTFNPDYVSNDPEEAKILIGMSLAFYSGLIQVFLGILHIGFVTKYLSDVIVAAFTTGAAYHIVASQLNSLLGIEMHAIDTPFKMAGELIEIFKNIIDTNYVTLIISLISMVFYFSVKHFINEKYKDKMIAPVPADLILVVLGTLFSYIFEFNKTWDVKVVGDIPLGLPVPKLPPFRILPNVLSASISIAIVSFAMNISMAKLFAKKYKYELAPNQELFAYGMANIVASFFLGFPSCVGLSRSVILDSIGSRTQVTQIVASILVFVIILAIGPLFSSLPNACLSGLIVVALINLLLEIRQILPIYRRSKFEALAWLVTFSGVIILDVDFGLYIGLGFSLLLIIAQSQRASTSVLGNIPFTDIYENIEICEEAKEFEGIRILRYESSLYYANVENFIYKIKKLSGINPNDLIQKIQRKKLEAFKIKKLMKKNKDQGSYLDDIIASNEDELNLKIAEILKGVPVKDIVIDFSCINYVDSMGVNAIIQLNECFKEIGVTLNLTYCKRCIFRVFKKFSLKDHFDYNFIFPTTNDAIQAILRKNKLDLKIRDLQIRRKSVANITDDDPQMKEVYVKRKFSCVIDDITGIQTIKSVSFNEKDEEEIRI